MPEDPILRQEYEARTAMITNEINKLDLKVDALDKKFDLKFEALNGKVDKIDVGWWKFIAITLINFLLGGGAIGIIEYIFTRK